MKVRSRISGEVCTVLPRPERLDREHIYIERPSGAREVWHRTGAEPYEELDLSKVTPEQAAELLRRLA